METDRQREREGPQYLCPVARHPGGDGAWTGFLGPAGLHRHRLPQAPADRVLQRDLLVLAQTPHAHHAALVDAVVPARHRAVLPGASPPPDPTFWYEL